MAFYHGDDEEKVVTGDTNETSVLPPSIDNAVESMSDVGNTDDMRQSRDDQLRPDQVTPPQPASPSETRAETA